MVAAIGILLLQGSLLMLKTRELVVADTERKRIGEQVEQLQTLWARLQDAESGQRGFLLTGDDGDLASYTRAVGELDPLLAAQRQAADDPTALETLSTLEGLTQRRLAELAEGIRLRKSAGPRAVLEAVRAGAGREHMNQIRATIHTEVERLGARRTGIAARTSTNVQLASYLFAGVSIAVVLIVGYAVRQLIRFFRSNAQLTQLLNEQATHDQLTGLPNRRLLLQWLEKLLAQAARGKARLAVFHIGLDGFQRVHDERGQAAGEAVLRVAATRCGKIVRNADVLARVGTDQFVAVLTNNPLKSDLQQVAQRLLDGFTEPMAPDLPAAAVSASIGIALFPEHGQTPEALLAVADQATSAARRAGARQFRVASVGAAAAGRTGTDGADS
jgi:diguanylate cyclase (GGDEF)-like protein